MTIQTSNTRVASVPRGLGNKGRRERGKGCVNGVSLIKAPFDKSDEGVEGGGRVGGEMFVEGSGCCKGAGEGSVV